MEDPHKDPHTDPHVKNIILPERAKKVDKNEHAPLELWIQLPSLLSFR